MTTPGKDTNQEEKDLEQAIGADSTPAAADDSSAAVEESEGTDEEKQVDFKQLCEQLIMTDPENDTDTEEEDLEQATGADSTPAAADDSSAAVEESKGTDEEKQVDFKQLYEQLCCDYNSMIQQLKVHQEDREVRDVLDETRKYTGDEQRRYALMFLDAALELFNEVTDIALCVSQKLQYDKTGDVFHQKMFIASFVIISLEIYTRIFYGVFLDKNEHHKDDSGTITPKVRQYKDDARWYQKVIAAAAMVLEPSLAEEYFYPNITKATSKLKPAEGATNLVRDFYNLYEEIKREFSTRRFLMGIFLIEDIPELIIELLIATHEEKAENKRTVKTDVIVWISLAATVVHLTRHSCSMIASWKGKKMITEKCGKVMQLSDLFQLGYSVSQVLNETSRHTYEQVIEAAMLAGKVKDTKDSEFRRISMHVVQEERFWVDDDNSFHFWKNLDPKNLERKEAPSETKTHFFVLTFESFDLGIGNERGGLRIVEKSPDDKVTEIASYHARRTYEWKFSRLVFFPKYRDSNKPFDYSLELKAGGSGPGVMGMGFNGFNVKNVRLEKWKHGNDDVGTPPPFFCRALVDITICFFLGVFGVRLWIPDLFAWEIPVRLLFATGITTWCLFLNYRPQSSARATGQRRSRRQRYRQFVQSPREQLRMFGFLMGIMSICLLTYGVLIGTGTVQLDEVSDDLSFWLPRIVAFAVLTIYLAFSSRQGLAWSYQEGSWSYQEGSWSYQEGSWSYREGYL